MTVEVGERSRVQRVCVTQLGESVCSPMLNNVPSHQALFS